MGDGVKLSYQDMLDNCSKLDQFAGQLTEVTSSISTLVGSFTGSWAGQAEATFEDDYATLTQAFKESTLVMQEITTMIQNYVNDMQEIENAYGGGSHVEFK